jgi:hypothetical protein
MAVKYNTSQPYPEMTIINLSQASINGGVGRRDKRQTFFLPWKKRRRKERNVNINKLLPIVSHT